MAVRLSASMKLNEGVLVTDISSRAGLPGLSYPEESLHRDAVMLAARFDGIFASETVERYVLESYTGLLRTATVKAHLTQNAVRFATSRLTALAEAKGALPKVQPSVLFVCEQNAGRSQMAAVLAETLSGGALTVRSAGSAPSRELHPVVFDVMAELGVDLAGAFPKPLTDDVVQAADVVVTMGCGDACPIYPGKRYQDWHLTDPAGLPIEKVRLVRDQITALVETLLLELGIESQGLPA
jgi:protein-tyrosine-phosphatase